jgi:hypothetical protein
MAFFKPSFPMRRSVVFLSVAFGMHGNPLLLGVLDACRDEMTHVVIIEGIKNELSFFPILGKSHITQQP